MNHEFKAAWCTAAILTLTPRLLTGEEIKVQLFEAAAGINGDSRSQCLVLKFMKPADGRWGPAAEGEAGRAVLVFHDAAERETGRFVFPADPVVGAVDENGGHTVLVATREFSEVPGAPTPDFVLPGPFLQAGGGKVCFKANPERPGLSINLCLSYGGFAGDPEADTQAPPRPAGPPAEALPIIGVKSLRRFRGFSVEHFGRNQRNDDFRLGPLEAMNSAGARGSFPAATLIEQGKTLFFLETFAGNGRTCFTCHKPEVAFSLPPGIIPTPDSSPDPGDPALPPDDPLFVAERVPALAGLEDRDLLRGGRGLILENIDGFDRPPVFRGSPALLNLKLTAPFGLSGESSDLKDFTVTAVKQHFPRTLARNSDPTAGPIDFRLPEAGEQEAMEAFISSLTLDLNLDLMLASAAFRGADAKLLRKGREDFFGQAKCFKCHNGPALAEVDRSLVEARLVPAGGNLSFNTGVAGLPGQDPDPVREMGRSFSTRPLVGAALRERFFHDNSAGSLEEVLSFYFGGDDVRFGASPAGKLVGNLVVDTPALAAFLRALVPPAPECQGANDCDGDGINDACELMLDPGLDCNRNGVLDSCDIAQGTSPDCNSNGLPDECESPADLDLGGLNKKRGLTLGGVPGSVPFFMAPATLSIGDLDQDSTGDLVIGASSAGASGLEGAGRVYGLFGGAELMVGGSSIEEIAGSRGFIIDGSWAGEALGASLSTGGDFNADGFPDLVLGTGSIHSSVPGVGAAYVVFGGPRLRGAGSIKLDELDGENGFAVAGGRAGFPGYSIVTSGDLNGDRVDDLAIGAPGVVAGAVPGGHQGTVFIIFGGRHLSLTGGRFDLTSLDGSNGFAIRNGDFDYFAFNVASGGDLNGDSLDDLAILVQSDLDLFHVAVVYPTPGIGESGLLDLTRDSPLIGLNIYNEHFSGFGVSMSLAGDLNGDRLDDLLIGAPQQTPEGGYYDLYQAGAAFVIFGTAVNRERNISTFLLDGGRLGFAIWGLEAADFLGSSVWASGDTNGDGLGDLVAIGRSGLACVIQGKRDLGRGGSIDLSALDGTSGVVFRKRGPDGKSALRGLVGSALGDLNGDGFDDTALLVDPSSVGEGARPGLVHIAFGPLYGPDCNGNGIPDSCDLASGESRDAGGDGVPDECQAGSPRLPRFHRGDPDGNGTVDISDGASIFIFLFLGGAAGSCTESSDTNNDGMIDITDGIFLLNWLYLGGPDPAAPGPTGAPCGVDPDPRGSPGDLGCASYPGCG